MRYQKYKGRYFFGEKKLRREEMRRIEKETEKGPEMGSPGREVIPLIRCQTHPDSSI
jgi:hypothetical protein